MSHEEQSLLPLIPSQTDILRKCQSAFCKTVQAKFNCMAILHNVEAAGSSGAVFRSEKRFSIQLPGGGEVSVWRDDLTRHRVSAVVNAANENLQHGGGLALALSTAGGPMIKRYSDDIIQRQRKVPVGEAVLTPAGNLPCDYIIHAVGPSVSPSASKAEIDGAAPLLFNAVCSILNLVLQNNIPSVAIPALSSGLFNFPRSLCADLIVEAIKKFYDCHAFHSKNLEIRLVNNDEPSVQEMERAAKAIFDQSRKPVSYSGAAQSGNGLQFGNVTLHLKKGAIQEEKVGVIVNTISADCNLSLGLISQAILNKAGNKIQDEINKKKRYSSHELYVTKGHNLYCKEVFHVVCACRSEQNSTKILDKMITECLKKAAKEHKSISFPAIGTGNLGFQKPEVAKIMTNAVVEFSKQNKKNLDVYFVVFPKDNDMMEVIMYSRAPQLQTQRSTSPPEFGSSCNHTPGEQNFRMTRTLQAFENEMKKFRQGEVKSSEPRGNVTKNFTSSANKSTANETPTIEFTSSSSEAQREAKEWAVKVLKPWSKSIIKNNHVIYLGQRDHESLLSFQSAFNVRIEEFFRSGKGGIVITGRPEDVSCVAIEVESMLCKAQEDFAQAEECDILYSVVRWSCKDKPWIQLPEISAALEKAYLTGAKKHELNGYQVDLVMKTVIDSSGRTSNLERKCLLSLVKYLNNSFYERTPLKNDYLKRDLRKPFDALGLAVVRVEKLENTVLQQLFEINRQRVKQSPQNLYQRVSAQFCDLVCRVGFQKEFAPPAEPKCGSGIYFSSSVDGALTLWKDQDQEEEQYIYIIQAQVLTGRSTDGSPDLILPPAINNDPLDRYDSVNHRGQTHVIFSSQQALPEYLFICAKSRYV